MQPNSDISPLLIRVLYKSWAGLDLDASEQQALNDWLNVHARNQEVFKEIVAGNWPQQDLKDYQHISFDDNWARVQQKIQAREVPVRRMRYRWVAAAAVVALLAGGTWYWQAQQAPLTSVTPQLADITPAKPGAILTLADGSTVVLDSLGNGEIANQQGVKTVLKNGQLAYEGMGAANSFNSIATPKGRQFNVILPDGSKVWLNAESSLRYPTAFTGKERRVQVTGEAYFEIGKNEQAPFFVEVPGRAEVAVLGTRFNINAYADEAALNTTLLEGAVKVTGPNQSTLLKPGNTAELTGNLRVVLADIDKVMAWKNGVFNFEGATLPEVMRQLSRWYDIEVEYEPGLANIVFGGKMSRDVSLAGLLRGLEATGVHFRLEAGRKLVVHK
ncbi:FecR family protein [Chitinophaga horti]|uniref:FecR family protein n=1 Tax=Chitinophaga horti TaxID=2920382 RepID=A0ABY6J839_9BACT|nr:FecR family protein [Chitinophaga horti]UYQ94454.1 FecR family protein [Chitinophaga horti]